MPASARAVTAVMPALKPHSVRIAGVGLLLADPKGRPQFEPVLPCGAVPLRPDRVGTASAPSNVYVVPLPLIPRSPCELWRVVLSLR